MKTKAKVIGSMGQVTPIIVGRTSEGHLILDFVILHRVAIADIKDSDNINWNINNNAEINVNGICIYGKKNKKKYGIDWTKEMVISKDGRLLYRKTRKPVMGE